MRVVEGTVGQDTVAIDDLSDAHLRMLTRQALTELVRRGGPVKDILAAIESKDGIVARERMTERQQEVGSAAISAMSSRFKVPEHQFRFIKTTGKYGRDVKAVILGSHAGIDLPEQLGLDAKFHSHEAITSSRDADLFMIDLPDGTVLDTRVAANYDVYHALATKIPRTGLGMLVPDMAYPNRHTEATRTLLTGVSAAAFFGPTATTIRDQVDYARFVPQFSWEVVNSQAADLRFRPGVLLPAA